LAAEALRVVGSQVELAENLQGSQGGLAGAPTGTKYARAGVFGRKDSFVATVGSDVTIVIK